MLENSCNAFESFNIEVTNQAMKNCMQSLKVLPVHNSFFQSLLNTHHGPDISPNSRGTMMQKIEKSIHLLGSYILVEARQHTSEEISETDCYRK